MNSVAAYNCFGATGALLAGIDGGISIIITVIAIVSIAGGKGRAGADLLTVAGAVAVSVRVGIASQVLVFSIVGVVAIGGGGSG